jgi:hypothetical protein
MRTLQQWEWQDSRSKEYKPEAAKEFKPEAATMIKGIQRLPINWASRTKTINRNRVLRLSHGQNCTPHSPEETYKRRVFSQFLFTHFCNGCSARDTRPQNLTKELCSIKSTQVRPRHLFHKLSLGIELRLGIGNEYLPSPVDSHHPDLSPLWMD